MLLSFDKKLAIKYKNTSQKIRVLTEQWVDNSVFCPNCGNLDIDRYPNNQPVADFYCSNCHEDYELKSKQNSIDTKIIDGAYRTMLKRITSSNNPNFFLLNYDISNFSVLNFLVIPKHFFVPAIIEKRKALSQTAKRAGWVGCNIIIENIPQSGRIFIIRNKKIEPKKKVLAEWEKTLFLREEKEFTAKGWLLDVMRCIDKLGKTEFKLDEVYNFESELSRLHPENRHIKDKIRQQLQVLRDKGYMKFLGQGKYRIA